MIPSQLRFVWRPTATGEQCNIEGLTITIGPNAWTDQRGQAFFEVLTDTGLLIESGRNMRDIEVARDRAERAAALFLSQE